MPRTPAVICVACFGVACERELQTPAAESEERHPDKDDTRRISRPDGRGNAETPDLPPTANNVTPVTAIGRVKLRAAVRHTAEHGAVGVTHVEHQLKLEPNN